MFVRVGVVVVAVLAAPWWARAAHASCESNKTWEPVGTPRLSAIDGHAREKVLTVRLRKVAVAGAGTCKIGVRTAAANLECYRDKASEWGDECYALDVSQFVNPSIAGPVGGERDFKFRVRAKAGSRPYPADVEIIDTPSEHSADPVVVAEVPFDPGRNVWATATQGPGLEQGKAVAFASGNEMVVGYEYRQATEFYGHTPNEGQRDGLVARFDAGGAFLWKRHFGGGDFVMSDIAVSSSGQIYVAFAFNGTVTAGSHSMSSNGSWDAGIARLYPDGSVAWMRKLGGPGNDFAYSVSVAPSGDILVAGHFMYTAVLGAQTITSQGQRDGFVARLSAGGGFGGVIRIGGSGDMYVRKAVADIYGNVYASGYFRGTIDFNGPAGGGALVSYGNWDAFAARYTASGSLGWGRQIGGAGPDRSLGIATEIFGTTYIVGDFTGSPNTRAIGTATEGMDLSSYGGTDGFIVQLEADGAVGWHRQLGWTSNDRAFSVSLGLDGLVWVSGMLNGTGQRGGDNGLTLRSHFGGDGGQPSPGGDMALDTADDGRDQYVVAYRTDDGQLGWSESFGAPGPGSDYAFDIATHGCAGELWPASTCHIGITGTHTGPISFGAASVPGQSNGDAFVAVFTPLNERDPNDDAGPVIDPGGATRAEDVDLTDGILDELCIFADEPVASIDVSTPGGTITLQTADAESSVSGGVHRYCWRDVDLPGDAGTDGAGYTITVTGVDDDGHAGEGTEVEVGCVVPVTNIQANATRGASFMHQMWIDADDRTNTVSLQARGDDPWRLHHHRQRANGTWQYVGPSFELPAAATLGESFDVMTGPDGRVHMCVPISTDASAELLYVTRPASGGAWASETIATGASQCSIAWDHSDPMAFAKPRIVVGYAIRVPDTMSNFGGGWPDRFVPHIARREVPGGDIDTGGAPTPDWFVTAIGGCVPDLYDEHRVQVDCGKDIQLAPSDDGSIFATYSSNTLDANGLWTARVWTSFALRGPVHATHPTITGQFVTGTSPTIHVRDDTVHVFSHVLAGGRYHVYHFTGPASGYNPVMQWDVDPVSEPVGGVYELYGLRRGITQGKRSHLSTVLDDQGRWRVLYSTSAKSGNNAEVRLRYQEHAEPSVIASQLRSRGNYQLAMGQRGYLRATYWSQHTNDLNYYQEENEIELVRSPTLPSYGECAATHFARMCEPLRNTHLQMVPRPFDASPALVATYTTGFFPDEERAREDLFVPAFPDGDDAWKYGGAWPVLWTAGQDPIDTALWDDSIHDVVGRDTGNRSLLHDIVHDVRIVDRYVPRRPQIRTCVPEVSYEASLAGTDESEVCGSRVEGVFEHFGDLAPDTVSADVGPAGTFFASADPIDGPLEAFECAGDPDGFLLIDGDDMTCMRCPAASGSIYSPALGECVQCRSQDVQVIQTDDGAVKDPSVPLWPGDSVSCLACPASWDDSSMDVLAGECARCVEGAVPKPCSANEQCTDVSIGTRFGYACGPSGFCERIRGCSSSFDCAGDFVCQDGTCVEAIQCGDDDDCAGDCESGLCDEPFAKTNFDTVTSAPMCEPIGCLECVGNAYCADDADCPVGHACVVEETLTPACLVRPVLAHPLVEAALGQSDSPIEVVGELLESFQGALRGFQFPDEIQVKDHQEIDGMDIRIEGLDVRARPYPDSITDWYEGSREQGVIQFAIVLDETDFFARGEYYGFGADVNALTPIVLRMFFVPYMSYERRPDPDDGYHWVVKFREIGADITQGVMSDEPARVETDGILADCADSCADIDQRINDRALDRLRKLLQGRFRTQAERLLERAYAAVTRNTAVGFMVFGYEPACVDAGSVANVEQVSVSHNSVQTIYRRKRPEGPQCQIPDVIPDATCR